MMRLIVVWLFLLPGSLFAADWRLDPETSVTVDVKWHGAVVAVHFPELTGNVQFDNRHPDTAKASIRVSTAGATTGIPPADALLRGPGFLDAATYPAITFKLDELTPTSKTTARISGAITMRGQTRPAEFEAKVIRYAPAGEDPAQFIAGFDLTGAIDRTEFGSTAGLPDIPALLPVRVRLQMSSRVTD